MRAVVVHEFGPVGNATVGEVPAPLPQPNEILLETHATAVNFVDLIVISGKYQFLPTLPFVPGKGPAGIVSAVGANVRTLRAGDRGLAMAEGGGYRGVGAGSGGDCLQPPRPLAVGRAR